MEHPWTPLDDAGENIRLIEILDTADGSISCRLHTIRLIDEDDQPDQPRFAALSYVWGDASDTEGITVDGRPWAITANLAAALRHVKSHWQLEFPEREPSSFRLWADALCINQRDPIEQGRQVMRMRFIYPLAEIVFAWLGRDDKTVSTAFELIDRIKAAYEDAGSEAGFRTLEWLQRWPDLHEGDDLEENRFWNAAYELFQLPYWNRAWIFQELVLSRRLLYCSASCRMPGKDMIQVTRMMASLRIVIEDSFMAQPSFISDVCWSVVSESSIMWDVVTAIDRIHGELAPDGNLRLDRTLHDTASIASALLVASIAGRFFATDPKDYVYALLSLTCMDITPDYRPEKSYIDVYCDLISHCLSIYPPGIDLNELWFLRLAGAAGDGATTMPSWLPDFADVAAKGAKHPLHIMPDEVSADADVFDSALRDRPALVVQRTLVVTGLPVQQVRHTYDCITIITDAATPLFDFCVAFCSSRDAYATGIPPLQAILRTLTRNWSEDPITPPECIGFLLLLFSLDRVEQSSFSLGRRQQETWHDWIARAFGAELPTSIGGGFWQLVRDVPLAKVRSYWQASTVQKLERCQMQLIETAGGYLGLAPRETKAGDTIAILKGFKAPVVLRKDEGQHTFIGACYVLGLMKGEPKVFIETNQAQVASMEIK